MAVCNLFIEEAEFHGLGVCSKNMNTKMEVQITKLAKKLYQHKVIYKQYGDSCGTSQQNYALLISEVMCSINVALPWLSLQHVAYPYSKILIFFLMFGASKHDICTLLDSLILKLHQGKKELCLWPIVFLSFAIEPRVFAKFLL